MFKNFLDSIGANAKTFVCVSISPNIGIEMIKVDAETKTLLKYAHKPLDYNLTTRDILSENQMIMSLKELFAILDIPVKSNIILNIPNVFMGKMSLPANLEQEAISSIILSEVEQSYIFKDKGPVTSWINLPTENNSELNDVLFTAIQNDFLQKIYNICEELGCTLSVIENSHASILKALSFLDITTEAINNNENWGLISISANSYSFFYMRGKTLFEYSEEPIPLVSEGDEAYLSISSSFNSVMQEKEMASLFIVSETDAISAELLSMKMNINVPKYKFIDCNKYTQNPIIKADLNVLPNYVPHVTLSAIGAAIYLKSDFPIKFNLIETNQVKLSTQEVSASTLKIRFKDSEIELTEDALKKITLVMVAVILIPTVIVFLITTVISNKKEAYFMDLTAQETQLQEQLSKYNKDNTVFNKYTFILEKIRTDKLTLSYYSAIGLNTPKNLWLTSFISTEKGVYITGKSTTVDNIYKFYKGIKQTVNNSDVKLNKLQVVSDSIDEIINDISNTSRYYEFEIGNISLDQLLMETLGVKDLSKETLDKLPESQKSQTPSLVQKLWGDKNTNTEIQQTQNGVIPSAGGGSTPPLPPNLEKIEKF